MSRPVPTLFLTVGLPCSGKTTTARRIEIERNALRLTKDEWVRALHAQRGFPEVVSDVIEGKLIENWPSGRPRSTFRRRENSTAVNL